MRPPAAIEECHTVHSVSCFSGFATLLLMRAPLLPPVFPLPVTASVLAFMAIAVDVTGTTCLTTALGALVLVLLSRTSARGWNRHADQLLDVAQECGLFRIAERYRHALCSGAGRTADPVHVGFWHVGQIEIDYVTDAVDVDA